MSSPLQPGSIAITCPVCGVRPVERAASLWTLRGRVFVARYGTVTRLGCAGCVRAARWHTARENLALGWWSVPWGLATPFVVAQNVLRGGGSVGALRVALEARGIVYEDVLVDENGMSGAQRRLLWAYANVAARIARCGHQQVVEEAAGELLSSMTAGRISPTGALAAVRRGLSHPLPLTLLDGDDRVDLLAVAVRLAQVSGPAEPAARTALAQLVADMGIPAAVLPDLLGDDVPRSSDLDER